MTQVNYRRKILFSEDLYSYKLKNFFTTVRRAPRAVHLNLSPFAALPCYYCRTY